jgi:hypothetical protein
MKTVLDASVLIDMTSFDLLEAWFALGYETITTSLVWREVNRRSQKVKLQEYARSGGLAIAPIGAELLTDIVQIHATLGGRVSLEDASVPQISASPQTILLSSDKVLRRCAEDRGITVHGLLWAMDLLVSRGKLLPGIAADRLEQMMARKATRLPLAECRQRIRKWRSE